MYCIACIVYRYVLVLYSMYGYILYCLYCQNRRLMLQPTKVSKPYLGCELSSLDTGRRQAHRGATRSLLLR